MKKSMKLVVVGFSGSCYSITIVEELKPPITTPKVTLRQAKRAALYRTHRLTESAPASS
jgi:hypothetical protein